MLSEGECKKKFSDFPRVERFAGRDMGFTMGYALRVTCCGVEFRRIGPRTA